MKRLLIVCVRYTVFIAGLIHQGPANAQSALITYTGFEEPVVKGWHGSGSIFDPVAWLKYTRTGEIDKKHCPGAVVTNGMAVSAQSSDYAREGKYSGKCILDRSAGGVCHKAMFRNTIFPGGAVADGEENERWVSFSFYLPDTGPDKWINDVDPELLFQIHNDTIASPQLSLNCVMDTLSVNYRYSDKDAHLKLVNRSGSPGSAWKGAVLKGKWTDWIWHFRFSPNHSKGFLEVWMNNGKGYLKIVDLHNIRIGYPCPQVTTCDIGIYKWPWKCPVMQDSGNPRKLMRRVIYVDEIRIGNGKTDLHTMMTPSN